MIEDHQIIYKTSDNNCVGIENSDITNPIGYTNRYINDTYGLIEFYKDNNPNTLLELNYNIFKDATNLISVELPSKCNRISEYEKDTIVFNRSTHVGFCLLGRNRMA